MSLFSTFIKYITYRIIGNENKEIKYEKRLRTNIVARTFGKPVLSHYFSIIWDSFFCSSAINDQLINIIKAYAPENKWMNDEWLSRIKRDIYFTEFFNRINADEYFRYRFELLSETERHSYVGVDELLSAFRKLDDPEEKKILANKYNTYCFFKPYYKREAILIEKAEDNKQFHEFCSRNTEFFIKPLNKCGGKGIYFFKSGTDGSNEDLFLKILEQGSAILEQPICQAEEMAKYHPRSINTVRVVTVQKDGNVDIVQTSVRLGTGDSIVDNGCLSASVDKESGIITSQGRAAHQEGLYLNHPDTGEQILGSQIPAWDDLLELVKLLAKKFKKQRIVGWDMAYSTDGWVIVEANSHPHIQVLAGNGIGVRKLFEEMVK